MLAARAAGPVDLHLDVLVPDFNSLVVFNLRHDLDGGEGGLPPGVGVEGGNPDQAVELPPPSDSFLYFLLFSMFKKPKNMIYYQDMVKHSIFQHTPL